MTTSDLKKFDTLFIIYTAYVLALIILIIVSSSGSLESLENSSSIIFFSLIIICFSLIGLYLWIKTLQIQRRQKKLGWFVLTLLFFFPVGPIFYFFVYRSQLKEMGERVKRR